MSFLSLPRLDEEGHTRDHFGTPYCCNAAGSSAPGIKCEKTCERDPRFAIPEEAVAAAAPRVSGKAAIAEEEDEVVMTPAGPQPARPRPKSAARAAQPTRPRRYRTWWTEREEAMQYDGFAAGPLVKRSDVETSWRRDEAAKLHRGPHPALLPKRGRLEDQDRIIRW